MLEPMDSMKMSSEESSCNNRNNLKMWLNENKERWLQQIYKNDDIVSSVLFHWIDDNFTSQLIDATSINDISLGFQELDLREIFFTELNNLKKQFSNDNKTMFELINSTSSDVHKIHIEVESARSLDDYISPSGEFAIGGFHLSSQGIEVIPKSVTPLMSAKNSVVPSKSASPPSHEVPRFTRTATVLLKQIGKGGSSEVTQGLYLPTMTMVAVSISSIHLPIHLKVFFNVNLQIDQNSTSGKSINSKTNAY